MFGKKLDTIMTFLEISNLELAQKSYLDPSYISRLRSGKRKLPKDSGFLKNISEHFVDQAEKKGRVGVMRKILNAPDLGGYGEQVAYIQEWLTSDLDMTDIIGNLLLQISEEELKTVVEPYAQEKEIAKPIKSSYYYGSRGRQDAISRLIEEILERDEPTKLYWYDDEPHGWRYADDVLREEKKSFFKKLISSGHEIDIVYKQTDYLDTIVKFVDWLPIFMTGRARPYFYDYQQDPHLIRGQYVAKDTACVISLSTIENKKDRLSLYIDDKKAVRASEKDFQVLLESSNPILTVKNDNFKENYKIFFDKLVSVDGGVYYKDISPTFYTLPDELAIKIDGMYPDIDFYRNYLFARKKFFDISEKHKISENLNLLDTSLENHSIVYGSNFYQYSAEDYLSHLKEVLRLLKEVPNYSITFCEPGPLQLTLMINDEGGTLAEKFNEPKTLFYIEDREVSKVFVEYFNLMDNIADIQDKKGAISHLEETISELESKLAN